MIFAVVDFPEPFGPIKVIIFPFLISKEIVKRTNVTNSYDQSGYLKASILLNNWPNFPKPDLDRCGKLEFDFNSRTKFVDMESGEELTTDPWHVKNEYKNLIKGLQDYYKSECRLNLIDYVPLFTDDSLDKGLSEYFNKRQKLG